MREQIEAVINRSGIWHDRQRETHAFRWSPEAFVLAENQHRTLPVLGQSIIDSLTGLGRAYAIASDKHLSRGTGWNLLHDLAGAGIPRYIRALQPLRPDRIPFIVKVDMVEGADGQLRIIEIDAGNRRAMGYASLFAAIRKVVAPEAKALPGIAPLMAKEVRRLGHDRLVFLYSHHERFYLPEFQIFRQAMADVGIPLILGSELEMTTTPNGIMVGDDEVTDPLFVNIPLLTENKILERELHRRYQTGDLQTLMPIKPFLGAKNMLAVIRNDLKHEQLEAILRSLINTESLEVLRACLPVSVPIFRHSDAPVEHNYLIKESVSSGAKGVTFPDDAAFRKMFDEARSRNGTFILQEKVPTKRRHLSFFDPATNQLGRGEFNTRIVVYFLNGVPAEAVVTACDSELVHGGKLAVNLGVVLE